MTNRIGIAACIAFPLLCASPAMAHPGHFGPGDFASGFMHPLSGADHLLTMLACGVLAAAIGGRMIRLLPAAFAGAMLVGGGLGAIGAWTAHAEYILAISAPALVLMVAARRSVGPGLAATIAACLGMVHGAAHGAELAPGIDPLGYFVGFMVSTVVLLGMGVALAQACSGLATAAVKAMGR